MFTKKEVYIIEDKQILLRGKRNEIDRLWDIEFPLESHFNTPMQQRRNYIITKDKSKTDLARYLHAAAFSPPISTFEKAVKNGNFITWLCIRELNFKKLLQTTLATTKGYLDQK